MGAREAVHEVFYRAMDEVDKHRDLMDTHEVRDLLERVKAEVDQIIK